MYVLLCAIFLILVSHQGIGAVTEATSYDKNCEYKHDDRSYHCKDIVDVFPNTFYGNFHLKCIDCKLPVFSTKTLPYKNSLLSINVSYSDIQFILPSAFSNFANAQYLYLQNNRISNVSVGAFEGLNLLYELHLEDNLITRLTPGFLRGLEANSVSLRHNLIGEIGSNAFDGVFSVMTLDLAHNHIKKLHQQSFHRMESLEFLELQHNKLCDLPLGVFKPLATLRHLNLANNNLNMFRIGTFSGLKQLQVLNLAKNAITELDATMLLPLHRLTDLDLTANGMYYFDAHSLQQNAFGLRTVRIGDNIFTCPVLVANLQYFRKHGVEVKSTDDRFDLQNIDGIACTTKNLDDPISFTLFLKLVQKETNEIREFC